MPPQSRVYVKRTRERGLGLFAKRRITKRSRTAYYPVKCIRDPGPDSGDVLEKYFVEVERSRVLIARPFSEPAYQPPLRGVPFIGWFVNEGKPVHSAVCGQSGAFLWPSGLPTCAACCRYRRGY